MWWKVEGVLPLTGGNSVYAVVCWYDEDPDINPDAPVVLYDQVPIPGVRTVAEADEAAIDKAVLKRQREREQERDEKHRQQDAMQPGVAAMIGHTRQFRGNRSAASKEPEKTKPIKPPKPPKDVKAEAEVTP